MTNLAPLERLRQSILPQLRESADRLRSQFPTVDVEVFEGDVGSATDYQGYHLGLDCVFKDITSLELPNGIALEISIKHVQTAPTIDTADVVWNHPSGRVVADILPEPVTMSEAHVHALSQGIPTLVLALEQAIANGPSSSGCSKSATPHRSS